VSLTALGLTLVLARPLIYGPGRRDRLPVRGEGDRISIFGTAGTAPIPTAASSMGAAFTDRARSEIDRTALMSFMLAE
jgi:hypothetical protein